MANVRIISSFTKSEREKLGVIQDLFKICIGTELPRELQLEKHKPVHKADVRDFKAETWIEMMGRGMLRPYCEGIINSICEYQIERSTRWFGSGYKDDPWTLFLEETKTWVTRTLSWASCDRETLSMARKRLRFMEHVLSEPNLFDPFPTHKMTMQQILFGIRKQLRYEMIPLIQSEIAHAGAREDLTSMETFLRATLDHGVQLLYHFFRDTPGAPKNLTVANLREANREKYQKVLTTTSGLLLRQLISSPFFTLVYQDSHFFVEEQSKALVENFQSGAVAAANDNVYLDTKGNAVIPEILLSKAENAKQKVALSSLSAVFNDDSGFEPFFRKNKVVAADFIKAHGLLHELAKLVSMCRSAKELAGQGGSLLVYGVANQQLNQMLRVTDALLQSIRTTFERLNQMAEVRFEQLVDVNMARDTDSPWVAHFKKLSFLMENLQDDLSKSNDAVQHIRKEANSLSMEERFVKAKQDVDRFVAGSTAFCQHISSILVGAQQGASTNLVALQADLGAQSQSGGNTSLLAPAPKSSASRLSTSLAPSPGVIDLHGRDINDLNIAQKVLLHLEPSVTELSLDKNQIGADGVMILLEHVSKYCPNLSHVNLWHNRLGSEGARALGAILLRPECRLAHLDINENDIGDDGAIFLGTALEFASSLEYLDLSFNSITDSGAQAVLDGLNSAKNLPLKFLKLSGNKISLPLARKFTEFVRTHPSVVLVQLGTPADNPNLDDAFVAELRAVCHPRTDEYYKELRRIEEEKKKEAERPRLKATPENVDEGLSVEAVVASAKKSRLREKQKVPVGASERSIAAAAAVGQMIQMDEELVASSSTSAAPSALEEADYYQLIRILQLVGSASRNPWIKKKQVAKAFRLGVYGATIPNVNLTFDEYIEQARAVGVIELREERDEKRNKLRTAVTLTPEWRKFQVPLPASLAGEKLPEGFWDTFIDICRKKPTISHRKPSKLASAIRTNGNKALQQANDDAIQLIVEIAIYVGIFVRQQSSGKYAINLSARDWPLDEKSAPPIPNVPSAKK
eukprot:TRINITY_DN11723_c0_g1_i1.p1 TRINITY_DN11723_c0_g1~~TRINITY_DN11723_c0_g1_i1.p1  ORF type:complete len:1031 (-),score=203.11 TRINITY_DN11723_c0_g1_i1:102-3194(-)